MSKFFKNFVFAVAGFLTVAALASCDTNQHEHVWESNKDATHHWQECACGEISEKAEHVYATDWSLDTTYHYHLCECGAKDEKIPHNFGEWVVTLEPTVEAEGSRKQTCSDCGREKVEAIAKLKPEGAGTTAPTAVYAVAPADWAICNIYFWTDGADSFVSWPGVEMTLVDSSTNLWGYVLPEGVENVIFNNGSQQTVDIPFQKDGNLYNVITGSTEKFEFEMDTYTPKETDPELNGYTPKDPTVAEDYTIYVQVDASWGTPNIYFWEGKKAGFDWPGKAMTEVDAANGVYSYVIDTEVKTVIFNGTTQTANLTIPAGVNAYVVAVDGNATPKQYVDGSFNDVEVEKETPVFYLKGSVNGWSDNDDYKLAIDGDTATLTVELEANVEFKIATSNWNPEFGWGKFVDQTNGMLGDNGGNIKVLTAGVYTFVVTDLNGTPVLTVTAEAK